MKTSHILVSGTVMALSLLFAPLAQAHPGNHHGNKNHHHQNYDKHYHQQYQRGYYRAGPPSRVVVVTPAPSRYYETREVYRYNDYTYNPPYRGEQNRFSITYSGGW